MSETGATPADAPATDAAATPQSAPSADTAAQVQTPAAPTFVQSNSQAAEPAQAPQEPVNAAKPQLVSGDWREMIPVELRDHSVWNKIHSVEDAMRSIVNMDKVIGKKEVIQGLVKPEKDASEDVKSQYRLDLAKMLEVPDTADRYSVPETASNLKNVDKLMQMAHKSGLGKEQFTSMLEQIAEADSQYIAQQEQVRTQNLQALNEEWGASYEQNLQVADIGLDAVDKDGEVRKLLNETGLNSHPVIIKHYHELGAQFREGNLKTGDPSSKQTVEEQILELKNTKEFWDQSLDNGKTRERVAALRKQAGRP